MYQHTAPHYDLILARSTVLRLLYWFYHLKIVLLPLPLSCFLYVPTPPPAPTVRWCVWNRPLFGGGNFLVIISVSLSSKRFTTIPVSPESLCII